MIEPLKNRTYRHLFSAQIIALLGTGLTTVALALLAYDLAGDNAGQVLGTALALKMIAYVTIAPVVGGLAASLPRRPLLVALDLARAGFVACLPFVTEVWQIYVLIFLMQSCSAGFTPTFQATIPDILPDERTYTSALSLSRLAYDLESLLSPTLAAAALMLLSFDALFALNALAFLVSAGLVLSVTLPAHRPQEADATAPSWQAIWDKISFGTRAYLSTPRLRGLLALSLSVAAAGAMVIVNTVVIVRARFGLGDADVAMALAVYGAGSVLVALALPRLLDRVHDRTAMLTGAALLAAGLLGGAAAPSYFWLLPCWFLLGAAASLINTPAGRLLRRSSAQETRPAYFAAQFSLSHACWLLTYPLAGWLGAALGLTPIFLLLTGLVLTGFVLALLLWPADDPLVRSHTHQNLPAGHPHIADAQAVSGGFRHAHPFTIDRHHRHWPEESYG